MTGRLDLGSQLQLPADAGRAVHPADTLARVWPLAQALGITRLARVTHLDDIGIPVWSAARPNARNLSVTQGKGLDDDHARASALMEAVEQALAERPRAELRIGTATLLPDGDVVSTLPELVAKGAFPLEPEDETTWVRGTDLGTGMSTWIPLEAASLDYTIAPRFRRYWQSTDGLASGNTLAEAILHGLLERIERDALALWALRHPADVPNRLRSAAAFQSRDVACLCARVTAAGHRIRLFDLSSDIKVPVIGAAIMDSGASLSHVPRHFEIAVGSGCHPDPARAAVRAITEAAQSRVTVISGARDDFLPDEYRARSQPGALDYFGFDEASAPPTPTLQPHAPMSIADLVGAVAAAGSPVIAVPLADEADFAVAKVLCPGLENPPGGRQRSIGMRAIRRMLQRAKGVEFA